MSENCFSRKVMMENTLKTDSICRCSWCNRKNPLYVNYHDREWGFPLHDDHQLFAMLVLEGFQAGISWECVLNRRDAFFRAFDGFDAERMRDWDENKVESLMQDKSIIRNRLKIRAAITNAMAFIDIQKEFGSFDSYIWSFTDYKTVYETHRDSSALSDTISKDLRKRGMKFAGTVIIYAYLEAIGIINTHEEGCFLYRKIR